MLLRALLLLLLSLITVTVTSAVWDPLLPTVGSDVTIKLGISSDSSPGHQQIVHRDTAEISTIIDSSMPSMDSPISLATRLIGGTTGAAVELRSPEDAVGVGCGIESGSSGAVDNSPSVREGADTDDVTEVEPVVIVLFMFFGLGTGIIIMQLLSVVGGSTLTSLSIGLLYLSVYLSICLLPHGLASGDPLPYTCVIFVAGMFMSFANKNTAGKEIDDCTALHQHVMTVRCLLCCHHDHPSIHPSGIFGDSVTMWSDIDPDIMLYVFLPPLIFGEAMSLNWHHVQGVIWSRCGLI